MTTPTSATVSAMMSAMDATKSAALTASTTASTTSNALRFVHLSQMSQQELINRKQIIQNRLKELDVNIGLRPVTKQEQSQRQQIRLETEETHQQIGEKDKNANNSSISGGTTSTKSLDHTANLASILVATSPQPALQKSDTHWDYTLKEMMWLSADFQSERKRQMSQAKKLANAVKLHHSTLQSRKLRERAEFEARVRRLAGKLGRDVYKGFWKKLERVVGYKQRLDGENRRRRDMDRHLVKLVRQTEKYGEILIGGGQHEFGLDSDGPRLTIEEALSQANSIPRRRSTTGGIDYTKMDRDESYNESSFYGEKISASAPVKKGDDVSTTQICSAADDEDYEPGIDEIMEEEENEAMDMKEFLYAASEQSGDDVKEEIQKLNEEMSMDLENVLQRLLEEGDGHTANVKTSSPPLIEVIGEKSYDDDDGRDEGFAAKSDVQNAAVSAGKSRGESTQQNRRVKFAATSEERIIYPIERVDESMPTPQDVLPIESGNPGSWSLLDEDDSEEKDEFHPSGEDDVDDETTIEAEEKLEREMSYADEIALLHRESEMSIHELKAMYAGMEEAAGNSCQNQIGNVCDATADDPDSAESTILVFEEDDSGEKDEYQPENDLELDDETTIEADEKLGREMSYEDEIALLKRDSEISIEELREMYANIGDGHGAAECDERSDSLDCREKDEISADELFEDDDYEEQDEFQPTGDDAQDDETTIEAEEKLAREMSYEDEIALLQKESEMTIEELKAMYISMKESQPECDGEPNESMDVESDTEIPSLAVLSKENIDEDVDDDDEFALTDTNEAVDDETTIAAEEKLGREMTYEEEISILEKENDMTLEELRNLYGLDRSETLVSPKRQRYKISDETDTAECDGSNSQKKLKTESDDGIEALQSLVESDAKARRTMLTRPFLLARWVKLRNYQQIGLNWLVSIQSRRLNGILADEMGLGKTLQTISMLAYLASYKGIWGPHLIIVPTSCLVNWEVEFKRFCPALKVLCYYGNAKRRKELRVGWTKSNWHHVVITSYQLAVQDAFAFKRKKWYYLVLDEAHNIKNFESQRWQTLINFNTQRRLLLTGTPLQNNLMELWSLLHFLMPHVFRDRKEFSYWFSNPMDNIIEGNAKRNDDLISRLHGIIRPFILRRLKKDVETQLPGKYEHIVKCQLSRRQMFLYEEFMARSSTRKALDGGNYLGMMNVLMQLRKVCNHPDLFEPRSVTTPLVMEPLSMSVATCVVNAIESKSGLEQLSSFVTLPLWSCGQGHPSSEDSARFDDILVAQLLRLMTPNSDIIKTAMEMDFTEPLPEQKINSGLVSLLNCICADEKQDYISKANFIARLNSWRCQTRAFPFPNRTIRAVSMDPRPLDLPLFDELDTYQIASTPSDLLAMRRNLSDRSKELDDIADKFVFCVPKAQTSRPVLYSSKHASSSLAPERSILSKTTATLNSFNSAFHKVSSRLKTCFPDKKLVQFDAGKLQTLAILLRQLKRDGHRVLIFTQMSKMLDVLEAFLNLNGHTYLRLDGATDVEKRQRLMDRFNSDTKIFCFILSTRSGGLGINLTGADTVVFYDSDWNPAMDAQAQDRAHRIGQTREVHIYRMVTEHSIEENILTKAKQKRNLDFLVMDEGKFHAASVMNNGEHGEEEDSGDEEGFTTGKLRNIFGITNYGGESNHEEETTLSKDQIESTMNMLEDEDDVKAMQSARKEAADELQEFDESIQFKQDGDETDTTDDSIGKQDKVAKKSKQKKKKVVTDQKVIDARQIGGDEKDSTKNDDDEKELEKEFANWQSKVGMDATKINDSLNPLELYGLKIKESVDPYFSPYYFAEQKRLEDATNTTIELDLDEIERIKIEEEQRAFEDGDLLSTFPDPEALPRQRQLYSREKARLRAETIKRKLTGQNWITKIDELSKKPFYFNIDTGEAIWEKPNVLQMLEANEAARSGGWQILPLKLLVSIMECLVPFPDRNNCGATCRRWHEAATDISFVKHVWPVEMGALAMNDKKLGKNHFRTIADAISAAVPGDTIELGDGHYWVQDPGLVVDIPLRIIGDEVDPSHVIVELSGDILWKTCGWMEGVTIRRPRIATGIASKSDILRIESGGRLDLFHCVFDNHGSFGNTVSMVGNNSGGRWKKASILGGDKSKSGLLLDDNAFAEFTDCEISDNAGVGVTCRGAAVISLEDCRFERNGVDTVVDDDTVSISDYNIANGH